MKGIKIIVLSIIALVSCHIASIASAVASIPSGWYIEGNAGSSKTNNVNFGPGTSFNSTGFAWNANLGYKFMAFFAGELGYTKYATIKIKNVANTQVAQDKQYAVDLAGKGLLPIGESGAELFAKIGVARVNSQVSITNSAAAGTVILTSSTGKSHIATGYYIGFGADYSIMPSVPINIQWTRAKGDSTTGTNDLYSVGIAYIFGC